MKTYVHQILITDVEDFRDILPPAQKSISRYFNPKTYEYVFWDKQKIRNLIKHNFSKAVLNTYDKLKPYAYKADLARYCIGYVYGGWYVDINIEITNRPPSTNKIDMCLIRDFNSGTRTAPWQLANGLFYTIPKHPVLKTAINMIVENVANEYYGKRSLSVTGPELFGRAVAQYGLDNEDTSYLLGDFVYNPKLNRKQFIFNDIPIALHKNSLGGQVGIAGTNNYVNLWNDRDIYNNMSVKEKHSRKSNEPSMSIHTDNPVDGAEHFGYALAFHKIKDSIGNVKLDGKNVNVTRNDPDTKIQLFMGSNPGQFHPNQYKIQMTQWESTLAPASWKKFSQNYNEFWTANPFGAAAIIKAGVPAEKVFVYEHGIDSSVWTPKLRGQNDKIRFLHVDSDNPRKRSDLVLWAFKKAFGDNPNYELTLKYSLKKTKYYDTFKDSVVDWKKPEIMKSHGRWDGNVRYIEEITSTDDLVRIYHYHDVLVYPSEGEGFGFIPLQGLVTGMPTISTGVWASYQKYFNGNVIESKLGPSTFMNHYPGKCVIPVPRSLVNLMKNCAKNIKDQSRLFYNTSFEVAKEYSWENKTKPVIEALYKRVGKEMFF